ncbi:MAG: class I SAM-dependent methyltransferase [Sedimentisphaerales bacterium]|nr:class I SAM-dependent methyltransferase [Sedimentisphaerales bacterium]
MTQDKKTELDNERVFTSKRETIYSRHRRKNLYCTDERAPFYDLAKKYLPINQDAIIVDIGAGDGSFAEYLNLNEAYRNLYLIDSNQKSVDLLKKLFRNVICTRIPNDLPFANSTVDLIHCSHLIEHLTPEQVYLFLEEIDSLLKPGGILLLSCPLLDTTHSFYNDISHVKPYNPTVVEKYLCSGMQTQTFRAISNKYLVREIVFRYHKLPVGDHWGSPIFVIDFFLRGISKLLSLLRIFHYERNGYSIVLEKY